MDDKAILCVHCGRYERKEVENTDGSSVAWCTVVGFLLPILGFILYAIYCKTEQRKADAFLKGAVIGIAVKLIITIIYVVIELLLGLLTMGTIFAFLFEAIESF